MLIPITRQNLRVNPAAILSCAIAFSCIPLCGQTSSVSVPGSVQASTSQGNGNGTLKGVAGLTVTLHPTSRTDATSRALPAIVATSDKDGNIVFPGVVPAEYTACVRVVNDELLDPCDWSVARPLLAVQAGKDPGRLDLTLVRGTTLRVRVTDAANLVPTPFQQKPGALFQIGVYSPDHNYHIAHYVSTAGKVHTYEMVIPVDTDLRLWVETVGVQLSDSKGARVDRVPGIVIRANHGNGVLQFDYQAVTPK